MPDSTDDRLSEFGQQRLKNNLGRRPEARGSSLDSLRYYICWTLIFVQAGFALSVLAYVAVTLFFFASGGDYAPGVLHAVLSCLAAVATGYLIQRIADDWWFR